MRWRKIAKRIFCKGQYSINVIAEILTWGLIYGYLQDKNALFLETKVILGVCVISTTPYIETDEDQKGLYVPEIQPPTHGR